MPSLLRFSCFLSQLHHTLPNNFFINSKHYSCSLGVASNVTFRGWHAPLFLAIYPLYIIPKSPVYFCLFHAWSVDLLSFDSLFFLLHFFFFFIFNFHSSFLFYFFIFYFLLIIY